MHLTFEAWLLICNDEGSQKGGANKQLNDLRSP